MKARRLLEWLTPFAVVGMFCTGLAIGQQTLLQSGGTGIGTQTAFTPASLSGLIAWYKSDTGLTLSGSNVTGVKDQSSNAFNLVNTGVVTVNNTAINSHPALNFTFANNAVLHTAIEAVNINSSSYSFFAIMTQATNTGTNGRAITFAATNQTDFSSANSVAAVLGGGTTNFDYLSFKDSVSFGDTGVLTVNTIVRYGIVSNGSGIIAYKNNVSIGTASNATDTLSATGTIGLGAGLQDSSGSLILSGFWDGFIGEVVITKNAMSATDRNNLDSYFTTRFQ